MKPQLRCAAIALAIVSAVFVRGQNTIFNDSFTSDQLNPATYPTVTGTSTGWTVATSKNSPAPTESGGVLTINMAATGSGFVETQALFASAPVQVLPGTYIELTATFSPTWVLTNSSDNLLVGLFNSGGSAPVSGLLNSGLTSGSSTFGNGGAKGWIGYNGNIPISGSPKMLTRPAQTGTNNTVQDLLVDSQSSSTGYTTPAGSSASGVTAFASSLTNGATYTLDYKLSLSSDGTTLTAAIGLYNGAGTTGTGGNTLIGSYSGRFSGSTLMTKAFDGLAIGWRADAGTNNQSKIQLSNLTVKTTGGAPWFTGQPPSSLLVTLGDTLNIPATAAGVITGYQWQKSTDGGASFVNIDAGTNASAATSILTLSNVQNPDAALYRLVVSNSAGSTASTNVTVSVSATPVAPTIITPPTGATVLGGASYTFSAVVNGSSPLSYQWLFSPDGSSYSPIPGATSTSLALTPVSLTNEGFYELAVSNPAGSTTSAPAQLVVDQPAAISQQPTGATLNVGDTFTIVAAAVGKPAPTYQWYLNGSAISGATNSTYTISSAAAANAGIYTMVATSGSTTATTNGAAIAVLSPSLTATSHTPVSTPTGVSPDTRLTLNFSQPVSIGSFGLIRIFDAANPTTPVDTIDLVAATALMHTLGGGTSPSVQALPVQTKTIGGVTNFNYYPITVSGNTATIYPRNNVLTYGHSYYVTIDPGVFTDSTGLAFAGITGNSGWTFSTKTAAPATTSTQVVVAADGSGDFYTVQGALDWVPAGNTTPLTIYIRKGTYFEQVYFSGKHSLTFLGEDRAQSIIAYPNNNNFNNASGTYHRMVLEADHANNITFANLTIQNTTPHGGSQAEALILNGSLSSHAIVTNVDLVSFQDTLQINGQGYVANSHITGDVDFMWGNGPVFLANCELTAATSAGYFTQIRNGTGNHGFVYVNCTFDALPGVNGMFLGRIDPTANSGFPTSEVAVLDSTLGSATNNAFLNTASGVSGSNYRAGWWLLNNASSAAAAPNVHNWTNNLVDANGSPTTNPNTDGFTVMPTDAPTQANYRNAVWVLNTNLAGTSFGSWTPQLAPVIATQPTAQAVNSGSGFTLSVQAFGLPAVSYQWQLNGAPIAGATNSTYTVSAASGADAGTYSVVVSNGAGSVTSTVVPLVVHGGPPVIALQPATTSGLLGATATLDVWALGDGPLTYQWSKDGTPINGATSLSLRLTGLQASDSGNYTVAVTNSGGTTVSAAAGVTVATPATTMPALPAIPAGVFDVTAYGAVGDGATDNTAEIQAAINAATAAGGGTVELPPAAGAYLSGPITLASNINFQIDGGATLRELPFGVYPKSTTAPAHFITVPSGATNIEFSGSGTIEGDGAAWWAAFNAGTISNRPRMLQITKATNVEITGLTFQNSPNFHIAFSGANNQVTVYGITISAPGDSPNTDGIDLAASNALIQHCSIADGDDNIVPKPGSVFCRNIYIADCAFGVGHGVSIGGQTNVGLDGMVVTNCTFNGTDTGLRLKADPTQGGPVTNLTYSNLTMTNVTYPIVFYSYYNQIGSPGARSGSSQTTPAKVNAFNANPPNSLASSTIPTWKNITISNLTATGASGYSIIWGLPLADALFANVTLNNVNISGGAGFEIYDATNVQFTGSNNVGPFVTDNALAITQQPQDATVTAGGNVTFSVAAIGGSGSTNSGPSYQWALNGTPLSDGTQPDGSIISGSTTASLSITNARVTGAGNYTVTVSDTLDGYDVGASALVPNSLPVSATSSAAVLTVNPIPASISLSNLEQTYDGTAKAPTVTTNPAGVAVQLSYAGGVTPVNAGAYEVTATVADPNYTATPVTAQFTIDRASATVALSDLSYVYDGSPKTPTVTTAPAGLSVQLTYNGSPNQPVNAGSYAVMATITDPNYTGSASDNLVISKATPTIVWNAPAPITYGTALGSTQLNASTNVPGTFTYSPAAGTVLNAGANQLLSVVFTPTDTANFNNATATTAITVNKATAVISLSPLSQAYDGLPKTVTATTLPANLTVHITYGGSDTGPVFPGQYQVSAVIDDPNYSGSTSDTLTVTITALVRHAPNLNGGIDGSIQVLSGENIVLNGNAWISGDLLVPGTPSLRLNGLPMIAGTTDEDGSATPTNYAVTMNGKSVLRYLVRRIDPIAMPNVPPPPAPLGTRNVVLNSPSDDPGSFATIRNLTLNGNAGTVVIPAGTYGHLTANGSSTLVLGHADAVQPDVYNLQGLTLNGASRLRVLGPVIVVLANGVTLNGNVGAPGDADWLTIAVANGGVILNGNIAVNAYIVAPTGAVTINGAATLTGEVISDGLTINGGGELIEP